MFAVTLNTNKKHTTICVNNTHINKHVWNTGMKLTNHEAQR